MYTETALEPQLTGKTTTLVMFLQSQRYTSEIFMSGVSDPYSFDKVPDPAF